MFIGKFMNMGCLHLLVKDNYNVRFYNLSRHVNPNKCWPGCHETQDAYDMYTSVEIQMERPLLNKQLWSK